MSLYTVARTLVKFSRRQTRGSKFAIKLSLIYHHVLNLSPHYLVKSLSIAVVNSSGFASLCASS